MEERNHVAGILRGAIVALKNEDSIKLKELSNQTIHCASCIQDSGSISVAILNYALGKIIERGQNKRIPTWDSIVKKISLYYEVAAKEVEKNNIAAYENNIIEARRVITGISDVKQAIKEVMTKASINKASRIYEHGISMGQVSQLLGVTQWEISEYAGQAGNSDARFAHSADVRQRAKMALEFFS